MTAAPRHASSVRSVSTASEVGATVLAIRAVASLALGSGRIVNIKLASLPNFSLPGDLSPSARYWHRDVVTPEWTMDDDGMVHVPGDRPGLGVTVDREFLDSLTVRTEELTVRRHTLLQS